MMKRLICVILAAMCLLAVGAALADSEATVLDLNELMDWRDQYQAMALESQPMNDPHEEAALSEDGYCFIYDFATIYADRPEMTAETVINAIVVNSEESPCIRDVNVDMPVTKVFDAFYNENDTLDGDREFAALYAVDMMPAGASWAWLQRDGQRIAAVQYTVHEQYTTGGDGYTDAGLIYTIQDGYVAAIRAYGLSSRVAVEDVNASLQEVAQVMSLTGYTMVPVSENGLDLTAFGEEDLTFSGITVTELDYDNAVKALGPVLEDFYVENEDGTWLRTVSFAHFELVFRCDKEQENQKLWKLSLLDDVMDGPRGLRPGDTITGLMSRFRHGENAYADGRELLYGTEGKAPSGVAVFTEDGKTTVTYLLKTKTGMVTLTVLLDMYIVTDVTITLE